MHEVRSEVVRQVESQPVYAFHPEEFNPALPVITTRAYSRHLILTDEPGYEYFFEGLLRI